MDVSCPEHPSRLFWEPAIRTSWKEIIHVSDESDTAATSGSGAVESAGASAALTGVGGNRP